MSCETCNKSSGSSVFWNRYIHKLQDLEWWHLMVASNHPFIDHGVCARSCMLLWHDARPVFPSR